MEQKTQQQNSPRTFSQTGDEAAWFSHFLLRGGCRRHRCCCCCCCYSIKQPSPCCYLVLCVCLTTRLGVFVLRWYSTTGAAADLTRLCLVDKTLKWSRRETADLLGRLVKTRLISRLEGRRRFTGMRPRAVKNCSNRCK